MSKSIALIPARILCTLTFLGSLSTAALAEERAIVGGVISFQCQNISVNGNQISSADWFFTTSDPVTYAYLTTNFNPSNDYRYHQRTYNPATCSEARVYNSTSLESSATLRGILHHRSGAVSSFGTAGFSNGGPLQVPCQ